MKTKTTAKTNINDTATNNNEGTIDVGGDKPTTEGNRALRRRRVMFWLSLAGVAFASCVPAANNAPEPITREDRDLYGLNDIARKWDGGQVPVCFQNPTAYQDLRDSIRKLLQQTWERAANIKFTGFGPCVPDTNQITVVFAPAHNGPCPPEGATKCTGGYTSCVLDVKDGNVCDGYRGNTDRLGAGTSQGVGSPTVTLISDDPLPRLRFTEQVIHEFGHALGFAHEMKRPDNWFGGVATQCPPPPDGGDYGQYQQLKGGLLLTPQYDPNSIMNYCGPNDGSLSVGDILAVSSPQAYGTNPGCSFVNTVSGCDQTQQQNMEATFAVPAGCPATTGWIMKQGDGTVLLNACSNGDAAGTCPVNFADPTRFVLGAEAEGGGRTGPPVGSTQPYVMCDAFNNCSVPFQVTIADCDELYLGPGNNPVQITPGSSSSPVYIVMRGSWIAWDHGVNATGTMLTHSVPSATYSISPGVTISGEGALLLIATAPPTAAPGDYTETVQVTDAASGITRTAIIPIRVMTCAPKSASEVCRSGLFGEKACGAHFAGCDMNVDCGSCGRGNFCSVGMCCPNGWKFDTIIDTCVPPCPSGTHNCQAAEGECMTAAECQAYDAPDCTGRACF